MLKIVSNQVRRDDRVFGLLQEIAKLFTFVVDADATDEHRVLQSLRNATHDLLDLLTEFCVFAREYWRPSFASECPYYTVSISLGS